MSENKHHKKKKKLKVKRLIFFIVIILILLLVFLSTFVLKVRNIYIEGNSIYSDYQILELSKLDSYPSLLTTSCILTEMKLEKADLIENAKVSKNIFGKVTIKIKEYQTYFMTKDNVLVIENGKTIKESKLDVDVTVPTLTSNLTDSIYKKLVKSFAKIDSEIIKKISEIEYKPSTLDKERFIFLMTDGNYSYVTLGNIENINYYNKIVTQLEGKKGIINFDSYRENDAGITITILN